MRKIVVLLVLGSVIGAGVAGYLLLRSPWAAQDAPVAFVMTDTRITDGLDGPDVEVTGEEYTFLAPVILGLAEQFELALRDGYAVWDPSTGTLAVHAAGQVQVSAVTMTDGLVALEDSGEGFGAGFVDPAPQGLAFSLKAPVEGLGLSLVIAADFQAVSDIADKIALQDTLVVERLERIATFQEGAEVAAQTLAKDGPAFDGPTFAMRLPGWAVSVTLPLQAHSGIYPDFPRTDFVDLSGRHPPFNVLALRPGVGARVFAEEKARALEHPADESIVLIDAPDAFVVAKLDQASTALFTAQAGGLDYLIWSEGGELPDIRRAWAIARSLTDAPPDTAAILSNAFDIVAAFDAMGIRLVPTDEVQAKIADAIADIFLPERLMERGNIFANVEFKIPMGIEGYDAFYSSPGALCQVYPQDGRPLADVHTPFVEEGGFHFASFTHVNQRISEHVLSGDFAEDRAYDPLAITRPASELMADPAWIAESPSRLAGTAGAMNFIYTRRQVGAFDLICGLSQEDPVALRLAETVLADVAVQLETATGPEAAALFQAYSSVLKVRDDLYAVEPVDGAGHSLIRWPSGETVIEGAFERISWLAQSNAILTENADGAEALWLDDGTSVIEAGRYDISPRSSSQGDQVEVLTDDGWVPFSVTERRILPAAE